MHHILKFCAQKVLNKSKFIKYGTLTKRDFKQNEAKQECLHSERNTWICATVSLKEREREKEKIFVTESKLICYI
jgi:hypothetical protein